MFVYRKCLHPVLILYSMQMKFSDGQSEFLRVFNFAILGNSRNSRKLDAREKLVFYSNFLIASANAINNFNHALTVTH